MVIYDDKLDRNVNRYENRYVKNETTFHRKKRKKEKKKKIAFRTCVLRNQKQKMSPQSHPHVKKGYSPHLITEYLDQNGHKQQQQEEEDEENYGFQYDPEAMAEFVIHPNDKQLRMEQEGIDGREEEEEEEEGAFFHLNNNEATKDGSFFTVQAFGVMLLALVVAFVVFGRRHIRNKQLQYQYHQFQQQQQQQQTSLYQQYVSKYQSSPHQGEDYYAVMA